MKYDELVKRLRTSQEVSFMAHEANAGLFYKSLADAITTLQAELELYKAECSELRANGFENAQDLWTSYVGLMAELEQCRKDADRYRALRKGILDDIDVCTGFYAVDVGSSAFAAAYDETLYGEKLDAAIDKAMESV